MRYPKRGLAAAGAFFVVAGAFAAPRLHAADHNDPGRVQASAADVGDPAADIADMFAWYTDQSIVLALTWRIDAAYQLEFDPEVLYGIHVDNDNDGKAEFDIWTRFGRKTGDSSEWGVKIDNVPGTTAPIVGAVGQTLTVGGVKALAGLFDDPFFFDLDGFFTGLSVALGNPAHRADPQNKEAWALDLKRPFGFQKNNDAFAGTNVHAVILEVPRSSVLKKDFLGHFIPLHVWGTSDVKPGRKVR